MGLASSQNTATEPAAAVSSTDQVSTNDRPKIHFDIAYLKTNPALLKIAECGLCLIGLICVQPIYKATQHSAGGWYYFVSMTGFLVSLLFLASHTFHVVEKLQRLPWLAAEMGFAAVWSFFFFIAASVSAVHGKDDPAWIAAAVIGFVVMCIYGYEAFQKYEKWHSVVPQGERQVANVGPSSSAN